MIIIDLLDNLLRRKHEPSESIDLLHRMHERWAAGAEERIHQALEYARQQEVIRKQEAKK